MNTAQALHVAHQRAFGVAAVLPAASLAAMRQAVQEALLRGDPPSTLKPVIERIRHEQ